MKSLKICFIIFVTLSITACQSKPVLKQVDSSAVEKPINSTEGAIQIKKQYEKP